MAQKLYMDHHVKRAITEGLKRQGIDVITSYDDGTNKWSDDKLLDRAYELKRVLFTSDDDHLIEATRRQKNNISFWGVIYIHQNDIVIGKCINDLAVILEVGESKDFINQVIFL